MKVGQSCGCPLGLGTYFEQVQSQTLDLPGDDVSHQANGRLGGLLEEEGRGRSGRGEE